MDRTWFIHVLISFAVIQQTTAVSVASQSLVGCGVITRPTRIFPYSPANYDFNTNTPGTCMQACSSAGYDYASVSAGRLCFCGISSTSIASLNITTTSCQVDSCTGDSTLYCGDIDHELVYASIGVIDSASIALTSGGPAMSLMVYQNYQFDLGYAGAVSFINYQVDFGDGTKTGWFAGTINTLTTVSHVFPKTGQFSVSVAARSVAGMSPKMSAMVVKVSDQISALDVSITCPNVTATQKTVSCVFTTARGTGLTGSFDYNTTSGSHSNVRMPDACYNTFGSSSVTHQPTVDASANLLGSSDVAILPQSLITVAGRIASVQFYSSAAGTVNIYLLRRICTPPMIYCYDTNTCGNCASPYNLQCTTSVYSTITRTCVNATVSQRFQQSLYSSAPFQIIATFSTTTSGSGYQQIIANSSLTSNQTAMVGDILAFNGLYIAKEISSDSTQDYRCITPSITTSLTCNVGSLSSNNTPYRYLLQATIIQAVQIAPTMLYYTPGSYSVQGTVTQNNVTSFSSSTILPVVYGIEWVEIVGPSTSSVNVMTSFIANVYPPNATVMLFIWYINGNNTFNSSTNMMNTSFTTIGTYTIMCQAQNLLSFKSNSTTINVQDTITNFTLEGANITNVSISQPLEVARFKINMLTGSNYACRINYDTNQSTTDVYFYTSGYTPGSYVSHQYVNPGVYTIFARCENTVSNVTYSFTHYVQYPIMGLQLQQRGVVKNSNFRLNFTIAQGTGPFFRIFFNGTQLNYTYDDQYNLVQTSLISGQTQSTNYTIEIYAWNYISSVNLTDIFTVVSPIGNAQIRASQNSTVFPGPIAFEYTVESGSNIMVTFSFGDTLINNPVVCEYGGDYPVNVWSSCSGLNHTFEIPGTITITAAFTNAIGTVYKYISVILSTSVKSIVLSTILQLPSTQCSAGFADTRGIASFIIQAANTSIKPASNAQVMIIPDAINQPSDIRGPFSLTLNYFTSPATSSSGLDVIYSAAGNYTAILQVSNSIDSINISCVVRVTQILQQVYYTINSLNWAYNNTTPFEASVFVVDTNPGLVNFTWDFGDGTILSGARTASMPTLPDTRTHRYAAVGTYLLTITSYGPINTVVKNFTITVQYPVSSFSVTFPNVTGILSQMIYSGADIILPINVQDTSAPLASNSMLFIDFNDSSPAASQPVRNVTLPYVNSYKFTTPGIFFVNFTVYNQASFKTQIIKIGINAPFNNYEISPCYLLPTLTSALSDTCNLTLTSGRYFVPKQSQLVVYVKWSNPSGIPEAFDVIFSSSSVTIFSQTIGIYQATNVSDIVGVASGTPLFRIVIDLESNSLLRDGLYTVEVRTRNPSYVQSASMNVYILSAVAGLVISDKGILIGQNVPKPFVAVYQNFSSVSCLYVKYSDSAIDCYGDTSTCSALPTDLSQVLQSCPSSVLPFTFDNTSVSFTHTFNRTSAWLYAYAWNRMTAASARAYLAFPITTADGCSLPQIQFDVYNPTIRWPRRIQRSEAFSVSTKTTLNCSKSLNNTKQWGIYLCDTATEKCTQTSVLTQILSQLTSSKTSEIYIKAQTLPVGIYLFNHTVAMSSVPDFQSSSYTYVSIVRSDIRVNLLANGTSMITTGVTQSILFQPGAFSLDPDSYYFDPRNWTFNYYCRVYGVGSYPAMNGIQLTIESTTVDLVNPSCFDTPGNTSLFKYGPNNNQSTLYIQPRALAALQSYEFKAVLTNIYDLTLQYTGYAVVKVQTIESILISAECVIKMCLPNAEYQRINPTTQALMTYPNTDIKWISLPNMSLYDNTLFYGRTTKNLTVTSALFTNNPYVTYWKFESIYTVTKNNGIASGTGAVRFVINTPPQNGSCSTDRTNGTTMTTFRITCSNWVDADGIKDYTFYTYSSTNATRTSIGFTTLNTMDVYLSAGNQNASYVVQIVAEVRDIYGAIASYNLSTITVMPDQSALNSFIVLSQQSSTQGGSNDAIQQVLYAGDQNTASQLVQSLSQTLNTQSSTLQQSATSGSLTASTLKASGLSSTTTTSTASTTNSSVNSTEALATYTAAVNTQSVVRDYAIQFIGNLSITNVDSIKLQASTMSVLTESTSELTRQAATIAATKCSALVNALSDMADTVSYEDVQMAVTSIADVASKILVSINTPMLGRGTVLNLDYDRANTLPADYDGDIESAWSNPNLFADGSDFSMETIQKNRNTYYQQQGSNEVLRQIDEALSSVVQVLNQHLNIGQTNVISTDAISMITSKQTIGNLSSSIISQAAGAQMILPSMSFCDFLYKNQSCSTSDPMILNSIVTPLATAGTNGRSEANINVSRSVTLDFIDGSGTRKSVENLLDPVEIIIPRDTSIVLPAMALQNVTGSISSSTGNNNRQFSLFYVNVTGPSASITLSTTFEFKSDNPALGFVVIYRFDGIPLLNNSINKTDGHRVFCPNDKIYTDSDGYLYTYFLNNVQTANRTSVMFGIRELNPTEFTQYCPNNASFGNSTVPVTDNSVNFTENYYIRVYTSGCYYLDANSKWRGDGVTVGSKTSHTQTQCFTNHLTTFAGGWVVLPAPINWNYVFANADFTKNITIYMTLILLAVAFTIIMIYARRKDKKDVEKLGVTPLPDNILNDKYYYQIIVFTGLRKDSGTSSKVHFIVSGDDEETGVRTFDDPERKILQRGGIDSFIMAVPKSLGRLNYMRVWHDNSGSGNKASWFLKYIIVRNLQTMEKNHFICQQWLAVEKDEGVIDRLIPVAGEEQKTEFAYLLSKKTYHSMSDGHLWFSVFSRPPSVRFTRTQRCTCCFVLLLMSMLMNIMYYDQKADANTKTTGGISMGPLYITPEQIAIGIIVELICFLPSTILVEMFRRLRPRRRPTPPVREALRRMQEQQQQKQQQAALNDIHPQLTSYIINSDPVLSRNELDNMRRTLMSPLPNKQMTSNVPRGEPMLKKKKKPLTLPWWFIFIAYAFSVFVVFICGFFIWARGVEFGDEKTRKWLTSSVTGFFSSILITQPVKVVFMAIFFALIIRRDEDITIDTDEDDLFLDGDEEYLHAFDDGSLLTFRSKSGHIPLTDGELIFARDKRLKEIRMWEIVRELIAYSSFLWILYLVSYSNRDPNAFFLMQHLREDLLDLNSKTNDYTKIYRLDQYWDWVNDGFLPRIRAGNWYNSDPPSNLAGFIGDKSNRILGWATMRQLRVMPDSCKILKSFKNIIKSCEAGYSMFNEDQRSYYPGWSSIYNSTVGSMSNYSSAISKAFMYNKSDSLDTYTYVGEHATYGAGGYVYEFRGKMSEMIGNISTLKQLSWIDMQTRGVMIQMSLYNPNVNLFILVTILAEFLPTGGIYPTARIEPVTLLNDFQGFGLFKLLCSIVYMIFIIYYMQREIRAMFTRRMAYFRDFWSYIEIGIIACSWAGLGVYVWRIREANRVGELFRTTKGYAYVNLQLATYVNDSLTFLLGFCCFFGTVKFLRLLRFNQRISMLSSTLSYAFKDLLSFTVMFSILYLGYLALFFLLFHSKIWACSDPIKAAQMLFEMMLLKFDVSDLYAADIFLGPFCFTLFVIFVVFICMSMFISIISDAFRLVRNNITLQNNEHEIVGFIFNQVKKWTGVGKTQEMDRLHLNPYDGSRVHYHDPVTSFPDKMDELIVALNKIYMDTKRDDTFTFNPSGYNPLEGDKKSTDKSKKKTKK
ncbi:hypothetical protein I4U23_008626 [Adineta vaga]|nr:hypothetical protein I4U23_008626 [Adineta vaga]